MSLQVRQLSKDYATRSGRLPILQCVDLSLEPGESMAVVGPSGSGKSTLLQILGTLDKPSSGELRLDAVDPFQLPEPELAAFRNRMVGFIFQDHHLLPQCTVWENVLLPTIAARAGKSREDDSQAVLKWARELLDRVEMAHRLDHRPAELSGGERQRVAVARAMIHHPRLVLADEPTGNLDRHTAKIVGELLRDLHREENSILMVVTHSAELAGLFKDNREIIDGQLHRCGVVA